MNATVKVHLLGREYLLRSQGDPELVKSAAALVEEKLAGLPRSVSADTRDHYMLTMLNLAGDFLQAQRKNSELELLVQEQKNNSFHSSKDADSLRAALIERIENALQQ